MSFPSATCYTFFYFNLMLTRTLRTYWENVASDGRNSFKSPRTAPRPLMKICRKTPISVRSIALESTYLERIKVFLPKFCINFFCSWKSWTRIRRLVLSFSISVRSALWWFFQNNKVTFFFLCWRSLIFCVWCFKMLSEIFVNCSS
jgi:hypothetical protein